MTVKVEVSYGELLDKITILEIKQDKVTDAAQRANVETELRVLRAARAEAFAEGDALSELVERLKEVNLALWQIEDDIRDCERRKDFGVEFVALARAVYHQNDRRAAIKREINALLNSPLVEEKLYQAY